QWRQPEVPERLTKFKKCFIDFAVIHAGKALEKRHVTLQVKLEFLGVLVGCKLVRLPGFAERHCSVYVPVVDRAPAIPAMQPEYPPYGPPAPEAIQKDTGNLDGFALGVFKLKFTRFRKPVDKVLFDMPELCGEEPGADFPMKQLP